GLRRSTHPTASAPSACRPEPLTQEAALTLHSLEHAGLQLRWVRLLREVEACSPGFGEVQRARTTPRERGHTRERRTGWRGACASAPEGSTWRPRGRRPTRFISAAGSFVNGGAVDRAALRPWRRASTAHPRREPRR